MNLQSLHASCIPHLVRPEDLSDQILVFFKSWAIEHLDMAKAAQTNERRRKAYRDRKREMVGDGNMYKRHKTIQNYVELSKNHEHVIKIYAFQALSIL